MNPFTKQEKNQLKIYVLVAFVLPYLLGILMWYGRGKNYDLSAFPHAQMFYPAAGVMLVALLARRGDSLRPKRFMITYLIVSVLMLACAILAILMPGALAMSLANFLIIGSSGLLWIMLLTENKEKRRAYGLTANEGKISALCVLAFVVLYFFRICMASVVAHDVGNFFAILTTSTTWAYLIDMPVNFLLVFAAFFGEEYGWRYFLQPLLQKRFGPIFGVLLVGVLWGLWHLPINLFYYSASGYAFQSVLAQQITCITLGIFMAYTYMKTNNIWVPIIQHFLNNNLIPIFMDSYASDTLANQTFQWGDLGLLLVLNGALFGTFLLAKPFRSSAHRLPTLEERAENERTTQARDNDDSLDGI